MVDLVVGIPCFNSGKTIRHVIKTVSHGLSRFFPNATSKILVSDGGSDDDSEKEALSVKLDKNQDLEFYEYPGKSGKGSAVRSIMKRGKSEDARAAAIFDSDLFSIEPLWIKQHLGTVLSGVDLAVPSYVRGRYDGLITNYVCYPLVYAFFGAEIRQPIGGDFAFSSNFLDVAEHNNFPHHFGMDIFLTTTAIAEDYSIAKVDLGTKEHESTESYVNILSLENMFYQVLSTLFSQMHAYKKGFRDLNEIRTIKEIQYPKNVKRLRISSFDFDSTRAIMQQRLSENASFYDSLPQDLKTGINHLTESGTMDNDSWASLIYYFARRYVRDGDSVLKSLLPVWIGRMITLLSEAEGKSDQFFEKTILAQAETMFKHRDEYYIH